MYSWRCGPGLGPVTGESIAPDEVSKLESKLDKFWAAQTDEPHAKPLTYYIRQYAGAVVDGKKRICVNLVTRKLVEMDAYLYEHDPSMRRQLPKGVCPEDAWRHRAISDVADGGTDFCGVTFDVGTEEFGKVDCNGL